jgi:signal transduction histidine kinase
VRRRLAFGLVAFVVFATLVGVVGGIVVAAISNPGPWLLVLLVPFLLMGTVGRHTMRRTWRPLGQLIEATVRVGDGESGVRIEGQVPGPIRPVVGSFNRMAERLDEEDERRRRFLSDVGHELKTPLTVLRGEIEALVDGVRPADRDHLVSLLDDVDTVERLVEDLRTLTLVDAGQLILHKEEVDVGRLVKDSLDSAASLLSAHDVDVAVHMRDDSIATVDPTRIRQIIWNLVTNAVRAMPDGGTLSASLEGRSDDLRIEFADTGRGIDPENIESIFERFVRSGDSTGSGLGLTIVRDLVIAHEGTITAENRPGGGAVFVLELPR